MFAYSLQVFELQPAAAIVCRLYCCIRYATGSSRTFSQPRLNSPPSTDSDGTRTIDVMQSGALTVGASTYAHTMTRRSYNLLTPSSADFPRHQRGGDFSRRCSLRPRRAPLVYFTRHIEYDSRSKHLFRRFYQPIRTHWVSCCDSYDRVIQIASRSHYPPLQRRSRPHQRHVCFCDRTVMAQRPRASAPVHRFISGCCSSNFSILSCVLFQF